MSDERTPQARPEPGPPRDPEAERAVLSACFNNYQALITILGMLRPEHFFVDRHIAIFAALVELAEVRRVAPDTVMVAGLLRDRNELIRAGGDEYLDELALVEPFRTNFAAHAKRVHDKWRLRQAIKLARRLEALAGGDIADVDDFLDGFEREVRSVVNAGRSNNKPVPIGAVVEAAVDTQARVADGQEQPSGVSTGLTRLDGKTAGLFPGDLVIVAARPGMGKSSLLLDMASNVAEPVKKHVSMEVPQYGAVLFSLEMPKEQLGMRHVCSRGRVSLTAWRHHQLGKLEWAAAIVARETAMKTPLWVDDQPAITTAQMFAKVRAIQAEFDRPAVYAGCPACGRPLICDATINGWRCLACSPDPSRATPLPAPQIIQREQRIIAVGVDYLQLMKGSGRAANRDQEIGEITRDLKAGAKELKVCMIALSQLNRAVESRSAKDKRPQLSDLRESGNIEQDADTIIFVYRDEYYHPEDERSHNLAELIIAKQRNGPAPAKVTVRFEGSYTRFDNLQPEQEHLHPDDEHDTPRRKVAA